MSRLPRFVVIFIIPLVVVAAAIAGAVQLVKSRPEPERKERKDIGTLVETMAVSSAQHTAEVEAKGSVRAARRVVVQPQLSGKVTWINDKLVPGGHIEKGEPLFRIEAGDYRIAVEQRETQVEQANAQLRIESGQQRVAKKEWELFRDQATDGQQADPSLALREPQLKVAEVSVKAAESQLEKAKLDLSRTTVRAPFNLVVESENIEVGQVIGPQSAAATVVGTDEFWVQVSVPIDRLEFINVPGMNAEEGSPATVAQSIGRQTVERQGRVARLLGELDPAGRMARLLVEVDDPFNLNVEGQRGLPLLLGSFVNVRFDGASEMTATKIPRTALREGDKVYVYADGKLEIRTVGIVWKRDDSVLISDGLSDGDAVVTSRISTPLPGMKLRMASASEDKPEMAKAGDEGSP